MGLSSLLVTMLFCGVALADRGSNPQSLAGAWVLLQGFFAGSAAVQGVSFSRHRQYPSRPWRCHAHVFGIRLRSVHLQEVSPCVVPPSLGPFVAIRAHSPTSSYVPSPSLCGTEGQVSATPIERVANCGFLVELLLGDSSGRPCPVR
jgi:hypothetical protein